MTRVIVPLVSEADRDAIPGERPHFLHEPVVQFLHPLAREESNDFVSSIDELRAVPPPRINCVHKSYFLRVTTIPRVFSQAHLLNRTLARKGTEHGLLQLRLP